MAGGLPLGLEVCNGLSNLVGNVGFSYSTNNTKGAYLTLLDPVPMDVSLMSLTPYCYGQNAVGVIDISIGASGSEVVVISNLMVATGGSGSSFSQNSNALTIPISIKAGTRISARCQVQNVSTNVYMALSYTIYDSSMTNMEGASGVDALGFTAATTKGVVITPDAGGGKGSYAQIISSTARDYIGLFAICESDLNSVVGETYYVDLAVGSSGNEKIIRPDEPLCYFQSGEMTGPAYFIPTPVPAGTRISARIDAGGDPSQPASGIVVYGVYQ